LQHPLPQLQDSHEGHEIDEKEHSQDDIEQLNEQLGHEHDTVEQLGQLYEQEDILGHPQLTLHEGQLKLQLKDPQEPQDWQHWLSELSEQVHEHPLDEDEQSLDDDDDQHWDDEDEDEQSLDDDDDQHWDDEDELQQSDEDEFEPQELQLPQSVLKHSEELKQFEEVLEHIYIL
jgi:hypothetical protein